MAAGKAPGLSGLPTIGIKMKNKKSLGQNWLYNRTILNHIADLAANKFSNPASAKTSTLAADKPNTETCVEIGPGLGTLTASLLKNFDHVIAIEYDPDLAHNLPGSFPGKNLTVINEDILKFDFSSLPDNYAIAGNIPYYITSPILEKILTLDHPPTRIVLLIQKEVAERIANGKETVLSLFVKNHAFVTLDSIVDKSEFTPPPKVDSQIIVLDPHPPIIDDEIFKFIKLGFSNPRKKLIHNLSALKSKTDWTEIFTHLNLNPDARPADLSLYDWQKLFDS